MDINNFFKEKLYAAYGIKSYGEGTTLKSFSPIDGRELGIVPVTKDSEYDIVVEELSQEYLRWKNLPAPQRGQIIREIGEEIRKSKDELGEIISLETGKILEEGKGEIQEIIDVIDYAVGLSRQLCGNVMKSERVDHRMLEQWHPLGIVGVITAFNFPAAVWGWNALIAAVCGNVILWKPSEITPLISLAINNIARKVTAEHGYPGVFGLVIGEGILGQKMTQDSRIPLISATGSCKMGSTVAQAVGKRLGKTLLELGGNNAVIVMDDADLNLAVPSIVFGAVGTAGQRCTSTRRVIVQKGIKKTLVEKLLNAYKQIVVGDPLNSKTLVGPLINAKAVESYLTAVKKIKEQGGEILTGGNLIEDLPSSFYVEPTIVLASKEMEIVKEETFAPILYIQEVENLSEAIELNNSVPQGLSSAIFTESLKNSEIFISEAGSDCGIANVNIGTSGAEIGGAFGGEKDTGGGRESGSDSWKSYMRRQTTTINYSDKLPLAQGIKFEIK